jgi:tRNA N6-adenosine threonylcarbamoyltransferase
LATHAADLKFPKRMPQVRSGTSNRKAALEKFEFLEPLMLSKFITEVPQRITNFGSGALMQGLKLDNEKRTLVLGIETTCDETAAAVVERSSDGSGRILSNIVRSQTEEHAAYGGVVPEIAARAHVEVLDGIVDSAMKQAGVGFAQLSAVAAAAGPGLIGGVIVGLTTAKAIAMVHNTPLIAVNHLGPTR